MGSGLKEELMRGLGGIDGQASLVIGHWLETNC